MRASRVEAPLRDGSESEISHAFPVPTRNEEVPERPLTETRALRFRALSPCSPLSSSFLCSRAQSPRKSCRSCSPGAETSASETARRPLAAPCCSKRGSDSIGEARNSSGPRARGDSCMANQAPRRPKRTYTRYDNSSRVGYRFLVLRARAARREKEVGLRRIRARRAHNPGPGPAGLLAPI